MAQKDFLVPKRFVHNSSSTYDFAKAYIRCSAVCLRQLAYLFALIVTLSNSGLQMMWGLSSKAACSKDGWWRRQTWPGHTYHIVWGHGVAQFGRHSMSSARQITSRTDRAIRCTGLDVETIPGNDCSVTLYAAGFTNSPTGRPVSETHRLSTTSHSFYSHRMSVWKCTYLDYFKINSFSILKLVV